MMFLRFSMISYMSIFATLTVNHSALTQTEKKSPEIRSAELIVDFAKSPSFEKQVATLLTRKGLSLGLSASKGKLTSKRVLLPLSDAEPFFALAASWKGLVTAPDDISLEVRASRDGRNWSDWQKLTRNDHAPPSEEEFFSTLIFLDENTKYLQYKVDLNATGRRSPILRELKFILTSPGKSPGIPLDEIKKQENDDLRTLQPYPKPPVVSRTGWGNPQGQSSRFWNPQYTTVTHLIVHHTATSNTASDWAAVVRSIWYYHTFTLRWGDVGYNYLIDPNGVIYEGRAGGNNVIGAHFSCANSNTMGVGMLGLFTSVSPSTNALNNLKEMLAWKADDSNLSPLGAAFHPPTQLTLSNISGHRDANPSPSPSACPSGTVCPGDNLYAQLPTIRSDVDELLNSGGSQYATLPYFTGFESGALDPFWTTQSSAGGGRIVVTNALTPHSGNYHLAMDMTTKGVFNRNEADLYVDLSGQSKVDLNFWWFTYRDDSHALDGVYFSDDGGVSFVKVFNLVGEYRGYRQIDLDIDQLASANNLTLSNTFIIRFQQYDDDRIDKDGFTFDDISVTGSTRPQSQLNPEVALLEPNFPNPFNPATVIRYRLHDSSPVTLRLFNIQGQRIRELTNAIQNAGEYQTVWDGLDHLGVPVASGQYFYELKTNTSRQVRTLLLMR